MLDGNPLDATGEICLPVLAICGLLLLVGEVVPPAEILEQLVGELGVAVIELRAHRRRAVSQQRDTVTLDAEAGAKAHASFHYRHARVIEVG
ncbi:hypothetical protein Q427_01365 [Halomonas sp. BC04]|nr:hypothetical protein Q427_01365 [Halomonas sp. BC04]